MFQKILNEFRTEILSNGLINLCFEEVSREYQQPRHTAPRNQKLKQFGLLQKKVNADDCHIDPPCTRSHIILR